MTGRRFAAIKRFSAATYNKNTKSWHLPLHYLPKLNSAALFSPSVLHYDFDPEEALEKLQLQLDKRAQACSHISEDPFCVSEEDISLAEVDLVFKLSADKTSLRAIPRYRSRVKRYLQQVTGVHYLKSESAFYFPTAELHGFVKLLRDKKLTFAVEQSAGLRLKRTAKNRMDVVTGQQHAFSAQLEDCLLAPIICANSKDGENHSFRLQNYTH